MWVVAVSPRPLARDAQTSTRINLHRTGASFRIFVEWEAHVHGHHASMHECARSFVALRARFQIGGGGEIVASSSSSCSSFFRCAAFRGTWSGTRSALNKEREGLEVGVDLSRSNIELERGAPCGPPFFTDARYPLIRFSFACSCAFRNVNCARFLDRSIVLSGAGRKEEEERDEKAFSVSRSIDSNNSIIMIIRSIYTKLGKVNFSQVQFFIIFRPTRNVLSLSLSLFYEF